MSTDVSEASGSYGFSDQYWLLEHPPVPELESVLQTANGWAFDVFALEEASEGHPLSTLAYWLLHTWGLVQELGKEPSISVVASSGQCRKD